MEKRARSHATSPTRHEAWLYDNFGRNSRIYPAIHHTEQTAFHNDWSIGKLHPKSAMRSVARLGSYRGRQPPEGAEGMSDARTVPNKHDAFYATPLGRLLLIYQNTAATANWKDALDPTSNAPETRAAWKAAGAALDDLITAIEASLAPEEGAVARMLPTGELEIFGDLKIGARLFLRPDPKVRVLREALETVRLYCSSSEMVWHAVVDLAKPPTEDNTLGALVLAALASTGDQDG
jgi:hypothetical protein